MFGGAQATTAAGTSADPKALQQQYADQTKAYNEKQTEVDGLATGYSNAAENYQECGSDHNAARVDLQDLTPRARSASDATQAAEDQARQSEQAIKGEWDSLVPERARIGADRNLAWFYNSRYYQDYADQLTRGILEKICEDNNFGGCAILAFFKACLKFAAAIQGISSGISSELSLFSYFKIPDLLRNQAVDQFARVGAEERSLGAKEDALRKKDADADDYYGKQIAEKRARQAEDEAKLAQAKGATARAKAKADAAKVKRDEAREAHNKAQAEARKMNSDLADTRNQIEQAQADKGGKTTGGGHTTGGRKATADEKKLAAGRLKEMGAGDLTATPDRVRDDYAVAIAGIKDWATFKRHWDTLNQTGRQNVLRDLKRIQEVEKTAEANWPTKKAELESASASGSTGTGTIDPGVKATANARIKDINDAVATAGKTLPGPPSFTDVQLARLGSMTNYAAYKAACVGQGKWLDPLTYT